MRILVIGGTAFMGPHVVGFLRQAAHQVTVLHRGNAGCREVEHIHADQRDLTTLRPQLERLSPEVVVHMVAMNEADAQVTKEALRDITRRVVLISSMDVYRAYGRLIGKESGNVDNALLTEDAPLRAIRYPYRSETTAQDSFVYSYDKILVEQAFLEDSSFETTVLRLPAVYGPHDHHRTFEYVKRMLDRRPAILLDQEMADWRWSRGYVEDVASSIYLAATRNSSSRVYNVAEPIARSEYEWLAAIANAMNWNGEIVRRPKLETTHDWRFHIASDTTRIRSELGYAERFSAEEAIRRTVQWEAEQILSGAFSRPIDYAAEDAILRS
jgi:nucleoside-diphosphate-sugar epimerase